MCRENLILHLSEEEEAAAEASLSVYCKPVELYGILQRRAIAHPSFLQRCLEYKIRVKNRVRLGAGEVKFKYWYYGNKLYRQEVTKDFSCPFCLVKCGNFKGLKFHLPSSHDLFNYDCEANEENPTVNIFVRTDICYSEVVADVIDPKQETFYFCSKRFRQRKQKSVNPLALDSNFPVATDEPQDKANGHDFVDLENCSPNVRRTSNAKSQLHAGTRKLLGENSEPRTRMLLQKRKFFHSQRAQPMALEQVLAEHDSEDEVDNDVADLEDHIMLDDFLDVTKDEKQMMHLWNSFVRKQRVLADNHIPWACEAFTKLHGEEFVRSLSLGWCWRFFMIKLWNHGFLDAQTMDKCSIILDQIRNSLKPNKKQMTNRI